MKIEYFEILTISNLKFKQNIVNIIDRKIILKD